MKEKLPTPIFELDHEDWQYKGIVSGLWKAPANNLMPIPNKYWPEVLGLIYVDETGDWLFRCRLKFHSGDKIVSTKCFGKDVNETKVLSKVYEMMELVNKVWLKNPSGKGIDIMQLLKDNDMVAWERIIDTK